jgi:hypothetical protein
MMHFELPRLVELERKLKILPNEWKEESSYCNNEIAGTSSLYVSFNNLN